MADPKIEEFCRAKGPDDFRLGKFRDLQAYLRDTIQPQLDERDRLIEENHRLHEENLTLQKKAKKGQPEAAVA